jgi:hypothetical protein
MSRGLNVNQGQDHVASVTYATSGASSSKVFTPADSTQTTYNGFPVCLVSDMMIAINTDATNGVWLRPQAISNENVSKGVKGNTAGAAGGTAPLTVDASHFIAATAGTAGEIWLPPNSGPVPIYIRAVGFTAIAAAGTPSITVSAYGSVYNPT